MYTELSTLVLNKYSAVLRRSSGTCLKFQLIRWTGLLNHDYKGVYAKSCDIMKVVFYKNNVNISYCVLESAAQNNMLLTSKLTVPFKCKHLGFINIDL